ncbi:MAG: carboxypeptidase-like regulatory domain-containing protein, partial [Patescibacteria group bacterium]
IVAFFQAVYSPTIYFWKKTVKPAVFFQEEAPTPKEHIVAPHGEVEMEKYLKTLPGRGTSVFSRLEEAEGAFLSKLSGLFGATAPQPAPPPSQSSPPSQKQGMQVPQSLPIAVAPGYKPRVVVEEKSPPLKPQVPTKSSETQVAQTLTGQKLTSTQAAQFSVEAAPPLPPEKPNTLTGQVMDSAGKIVEAAILEVRDVAGRPVRAVRTNKVGHFLVITPLQNGKYEILTEKEGLEFDPVTFEAKGTIIPPIAIRAKNRLTAETIVIN